ncbi:hypothetical protein RJ641_006248, partial [Dillenia turbinata]
VKEYNSDDDEPSTAAENENLLSPGKDEVAEGNSDVDNAEVEVSEGEGEEDGAQPGITKFTEGIAFKKITKENLTDDPLGPVLSRQKQLLAEKLAEEESEQKVKGESKKEKKLIIWLDVYRLPLGGYTSSLIWVNKAQNAQKGLDPSRFKDAKGKTSAPAQDKPSGGQGDSEGPAWAPLRDSYMLTTSKLKDWDKMEASGYEDAGRSLFLQY